MEIQKKIQNNFPKLCYEYFFDVVVWQQLGMRISAGGETFWDFTLWKSISHHFWEPTRYGMLRVPDFLLWNASRLKLPTVGRFTIQTLTCRTIRVPKFPLWETPCLELSPVERLATQTRTLCASNFHLWDAPRPKLPYMERSASQKPLWDVFRS